MRKKNCIHILRWSVTQYYHHPFYLFSYKVWGREIDVWLMARFFLCKGIKRCEYIHCQCFHFGHINKLFMLIMEEYINMFIYFFSHVLTVSVSLFSHKCRSPCPYSNPCLNHCLSFVGVWLWKTTFYWKLVEVILDLMTSSQTKSACHSMSMTFGVDRRLPIKPRRASGFYASGW